MTGGAVARPGLRPWSFVLCFGTVSLQADVIYEGARAVTGPLLLAAAIPPRRLLAAIPAHRPSSSSNG